MKTIGRIGAEGDALPVAAVRHVDIGLVAHVSDGSAIVRIRVKVVTVANVGCFIPAARFTRCTGISTRTAIVVVASGVDAFAQRRTVNTGHGEAIAQNKCGRACSVSTIECVFAVAARERYSSSKFGCESALFGTRHWRHIEYVLYRQCARHVRESRTIIWYWTQLRRRYAEVVEHPWVELAFIHACLRQDAARSRQASASVASAIVGIQHVRAAAVDANLGCYDVARAAAGAAVVDVGVRVDAIAAAARQTERARVSAESAISVVRHEVDAGAVGASFARGAFVPRRAAVVIVGFGVDAPAGTFRDAGLSGDALAVAKLAIVSVLKSARVVVALHLRICTY